SKYSEWLEKQLKKGVIKYFDYSEFRNVKVIGRGGYGIVYYANYHGTEIVFKKPIDEIAKAFINELKQLITARDCQNVIKVLGITTGMGNILL
ncbi:5618_t:CDS:2, partial [Cetraspora pellucida]